LRGGRFPVLIVIRGAHDPQFAEVRAQEALIYSGSWRFDADIVGRAEIVIRQEVVDPGVIFEGGYSLSPE
jgi:hypothetical protein